MAPRPPTQLPGQPVHLPVQVAQLPVPQYPVPFMPAAALEGANSISETHNVTRSNYYYLKQKQEQELASNKTRKYVRSSKPIVCGKYGKISQISTNSTLEIGTARKQIQFPTNSGKNSTRIADMERKGT